MINTMSDNDTEYGVCTMCGNLCNICSQTCGRCARKLSDPEYVPCTNRFQFGRPLYVSHPDVTTHPSTSCYIKQTVTTTHPDTDIYQELVRLKSMMEQQLELIEQLLEKVVQK